MKPELCYVIWYAPRSGSNLLCDALTDTGIAGRPGEFLSAHDTFNLYAKYQVSDPVALREAVWALGTTENGVFGMKCQMYEPYFENILSYLAGTPGTLDPLRSRLELWDEAFPNCRHIVLTRRNKFRQAVSWCKASQLDAWFHEPASERTERDREAKYDLDRIAFYLLASVCSDAALAEFFSGAGSQPLTIIYEDLADAHDQTVRALLDYIGVPGRDGVEIPRPRRPAQADEQSEEWLGRFRDEYLGEFGRRW